MEKNIWIKPEYELELFVPNHYIAACSPGVRVSSNGFSESHQLLKSLSVNTYNIWLDTNGNLQLDGEFDINNNWTGTDILQTTNPATHDSNQGLGADKCYLYAEEGGNIYLVQDKQGGPVHYFRRVRVFSSHEGTGNHHYYLREDVFTSCNNS